MVKRGVVRNPSSQDSPSEGSQGSGGRLASNQSTPTGRRQDSTPRRVDTRPAPYQSTPISRGGSRPTLHESAPRRAHHIPMSHDFIPTIPKQSTVTPLSQDGFRRLGGDRVDCVGGFTGLLQQMDVDPNEAHFSDEESDNGDREDMDREDTPFGSNSRDVPPYGTSKKPFITAVGKKFRRGFVVRAIRKLINQYVSGPWISFKHIPEKVIMQMWGHFQTLFDWDPTDGRINTNFRNVIQSRYSDFMRDFRIYSASMAIAAGHTISPKGKDFDIMLNFKPPKMEPDRWVVLCREWNKDAWRKRSESGTSNRNSTDNGGNISRHTGGSIGYDEHRIRLTAKFGHPPTFLELFLWTHLDKSSKLKYFGGDHDEGNQFCTERAREAYEAYSRALLEKYGDDLREHPIDDPDLWVKIQKQINPSSKNKYIYGIGSSDLEFVVTGKSSASAGCSSSSCGSQQEVLELRTKLEQAEKDRLEMQERQGVLEQQIAQIMKHVGIPSQTFNQPLENPV